jgi:hypothetical protein
MRVKQREGGETSPQTPENRPQRPRGLTVADLAAAKKLPEGFLRSLGLRDVTLRDGPAVVIPYLDEHGNEVATRYRLSLDGDLRFRWKRGASILPYGLQRLMEARRLGWALIVEGESDVWTAWHHDIPAIGLPGKSCWRPEWAEWLRDTQVFVWQEPGAADFTERISRDLPEARVIIAPADHKDVSEIHCAGEDVVRVLEELKQAAQPVAAIVQKQRDATVAALAAEAAPVLAADDPLALVESELRRLGYGGDLTPALVTYLCLTTRLLTTRPGAMPAHLLLVGPPSAGKSYTLQTVLRLFPPEAYHTIDAGSPRVLIYDDADLQHRAVIFSEADSLPAGEDNPAASAVRNLLQDHHLHYAVTVRDPESGRFTVREIEKPGPSVLVTTAVRTLGGQLGTRVFMLPVPEEADRIRQVLATQAELELASAAEPNGALVAYQAYLQRLTPIDVLVPFARELAEAVGRSANAPRILRDFQRLLALVKAVAILRHRHRVRNADGRLVAIIEDYEAIFDLVDPMYAATLTGATEQVRQVVNAVRALRAEGAERVTYSAVAKRTGLHVEQVKRIARIAIAHDWLANREERKHKPADLEPGEPLPERMGLPTPDELGEAFHKFHTTSDEALHKFHSISQHFTLSQPNRRVSAHAHDAGTSNNPPEEERANSDEQEFWDL